MDAGYPVVPKNAISSEELEALRGELEPLLDLRLDWLSIPVGALLGFEPSQLAVITNTILDGALPQVTLLSSDDPVNAAKLAKLGLTKAPRTIGEREGYPDYVHASGKRVELKGLFVDNADLDLKRPPTKREPSARLKENVTLETVDPANDTLLVAATQIRVVGDRCCPVIVDIGLFSMVECIVARDTRLIDSPGRWMGRLPKVLSLKGRVKQRAGELIGEEDYEKDTNFGKLNRIPYEPLVMFLRKHGYFPPRSRRKAR